MKHNAIVTSVTCVLTAGVAADRQQADVPQLLQDEAVNHPGRVADAVRRRAQLLQSHVSPSTYVPLVFTLRIYRFESICMV